MAAWFLRGAMVVQVDPYSENEMCSGIRRATICWGLDGFVDLMTSLVRRRCSFLEATTYRKPMITVLLPKKGGQTYLNGGLEDCQNYV